MSNYTILWMFENPRSGRQARNFTTNAPKILDLKSSSEQIFSRKLPLGAPELSCLISELRILKNHKSTNIQRIDLCLVSFDSFGSLLFRKKKKKDLWCPDEVFRIICLELYGNYSNDRSSLLSKRFLARFV